MTNLSVKDEKQANRFKMRKFPCFHSNFFHAVLVDVLVLPITHDSERSELFIFLLEKIHCFLRQQAGDDDGDDLAEGAQHESTKEKLERSGQQQKTEGGSEEAEEPLDERVAQRRTLGRAV